jgi:predicted nucleotidyltransferase
MSIQLLKDLARHLDQANLPYMIIGGQAVLLYGEPRLTRDVDVTLGATPERLEEVLGVAEAMALRPLVDDPAAFVQQTSVLPTLDEESGLRVDFIFSWTPYEQQAIARARVVEVAGRPVRFAAPEDVIVHKVLAGRPRDWEDIRSILRKQDVDSAYIQRWLREFSSTVAKDLVMRFEELYQEVHNEDYDRA